MKVIGITNTAILSVLLGIAGSAYGQHEQQGGKPDQARPEQQHARPQGQSEQRQKQAKHAQQHAEQQHGPERAPPATTRSATGPAEALGSNMVQETGSRTTAPGINVEAATATALTIPGSVNPLGRRMGSKSTASPNWLLADIRASSTKAIGLVSLTLGQNHGRITACASRRNTCSSTTPTTSTSPTSTTATTC
jgi:hypothetical protein